MAHRTARLNQFGRQLLIDRVIRDGWTVATAAEAQGVSRATGHKWVRRYRLEGPAGLADRSSRPHRSPRMTPPHEVQRIIAARQEWRWGPDRLGPLLGHPPSTVGAVLRRSRMPRLADIDRPTGLPVRRYEVCHPGALVHQDHKKLGRIPDGGGHRAFGRTTETRRRKTGLGYDHFEVIVDDRTRRSVVVAVPDESGSSAAAEEPATPLIAVDRLLGHRPLPRRHLEQVALGDGDLAGGSSRASAPCTR
ncbi:MAG: leucine zipper domain-containing protein [Solirubrobacterales bacterium]